jgi:SAM-dependent methyltransferase
MRLVPLLLLLGCAAPRSGTVPADPPSASLAPRVAPAAAVPVAPMLDEATVTAKTHAWFVAFDRADLAGVQAELAPGFFELANGRFYDTKWTLSGMQARIDRHAPIRSRTWGIERVQLAPNLAVFTGQTTEHVPVEGDNPAADSIYWYVAVWSYDGAAWKLAQLTRVAGGPDAEREMWNTTLRKQVGFRTTVNRFLAEWAKGKKPGTALDLLSGQGRNAVWLATQGWKVTAVDISDAGLEITAKAALAAKTRVTTVLADIDTWDLGKDRWDLVTLIYAGSNHALIERIKPSIKKGGWFVAEFFGKDATAGTGIGGFSPGELAALFPGWKIEKDEVVEDVADWGLRKQKVARFAAQKP